MITISPITDQWPPLIGSQLYCCSAHYRLRDDCRKYLESNISEWWSLFQVCAIIGNSLVMYVVLVSRRMQTVTNFYIANLALSDVVLALFCIPFQFRAALIQRWDLPEFMCQFCPFMQTLSVSWASSCPPPILLACRWTSRCGPWWRYVSTDTKPSSNLWLRSRARRRPAWWSSSSGWPEAWPPSPWGRLTPSSRSSTLTTAASSHSAVFAGPALRRTRLRRRTPATFFSSCSRSTSWSSSCWSTWRLSPSSLSPTSRWGWGCGGPSPLVRRTSWEMTKFWGTRRKWAGRNCRQIYSHPVMSGPPHDVDRGGGVLPVLGTLAVLLPHLHRLPGRQPVEICQHHVLHFSLAGHE